MLEVFQDMKKGKTSRQIIFAIVAVLCVAGLAYPISDWIGYRSVALLLLLLVSVLATRLSLPAVLLAAVLSALVWDFFFIPPHFTFTIGTSEDLLLIVMYFIVALLNGVINYRVRQFEREKQQRKERERAIALYNTLFNSLSHDLRTPIATIIGAADALREQSAALTPSQQEELLTEIGSGAIRLSEQVENLLNMSRLEAGRIQVRKAWCDVGDLVYGVAAKLKREGREHHLDISVPEDMPLVRLDFGLSEQVLLNLLSNAYRHTPPGGRINIQARISAEISGHFERQAGEQTPVNASMALVHDKVTHCLYIEISDNGPGFSDADIALAFDKFNTLSNAKADGTGLGLYIVKGFTEAQGGNVHLSNRFEGGARFVLEFPTAVIDQSIHYA